MHSPLPGDGAGKERGSPPGATTRREGERRDAAPLAAVGHDDGVVAAPHTHYVDEIVGGDGAVRSRDEGHNLVVAGFARLLAALFQSLNGYAGVQYWAVGSGDPNDNPLTPTAANPLATKLVNEIARVPVTTSFVDELGEPTASITNRVRVQATFDPGVGSGNNVEFGLFGGDAAATSDSGFLIDLVVHPVKVKLADETRRLTLVFTF